MKNLLPGLNGLRAIAASYILVGHTFYIAGDLSDPFAKEIFESGFSNRADMVNLFFVISGFIISLLLLKEKDTTGTIALGSFYKRRFYRIFPLYYLLLIFLFLVGTSKSLNLGLTPLSNDSLLVIGLFGVTLNPFFQVPLYVLPHYWSLSVEEQFYIFWPWLLRKVNIVLLCMSVISITLILRNCAALMSHSNSKYSPFFLKLNEVLYASKFSSMAIGGLGAYLFYYMPEYLKFLKIKAIKIIIVILFLFNFGISSYVPYVQSEFQAFIYLASILLSVQKKHFLLDNKLIDLTGRISYGIYMFQVPVLYFLIYFLKKYHLYQMASHPAYILLILIGYLITYAVAWLSYKYFEQPILGMKRNQKKMAAAII